MSSTDTAKRERRSAILEAAIAAYAKRGYHQTRVEDIAAEADVSKGTIYLYFESRESILVAAFNQFMQQFGVGVAEILNSRSAPLEKIRQVFDETFRAAAENETLSRVMMDFWAASVHNPDMPHIDLSKAYAEYRAVIADLLKQAVKQGDIRKDHPSMTANIILASLDGIILHWMMDPKLVPLNNISSQLFDLLVGGLRK
jgi:TetR/AcrR family fatty acid metabolism transcriptional regulator